MAPSGSTAHGRLEGEWGKGHADGHQVLQIDRPSQQDLTDTIDAKKADHNSLGRHWGDILAKTHQEMETLVDHGPRTFGVVSQRVKDTVGATLSSGLAVGLMTSDLSLRLLNQCFWIKGPRHVLDFGRFVHKVMSMNNHLSPPIFSEIATKAFKEGFWLEKYNVTTRDGYGLQIHRIRHRRGQSVWCQPRRVVFLQHGLKCSSADWIIGRLAYVLHDAGCDVWMGNFRGNTYSRKHQTLSFNDPKYWDFSWDEHGIFDLPTMIDYVLATTKRSQLEFICHSMGSTAFFVMMNHHPAMNAKIQKATLMAPVTQIARVTGHPQRFLRGAETCIELANAAGVHSINLPKRLPLYTIMSTLVTYVTGYHQCDIDTLGDILSFSPASTSTQNVMHYLKCRKRGTFSSFRGEREYNLKCVTCPVRIFWSPCDWAAGTEDVAAIRQELPNVVEFLKVPKDNFGHLDFMWSKPAMTIYQMIAREP
eukprot:snap_masked-scaffold645_size120276-processed-gene-0.22 protein:Tk11130 transcript:snap_masked-scaffold645_size120276-processed-gene-0.22-mRNA-1 annotation:"lipase 3"